MVESLWTDDYAAQQRYMHLAGNYGLWGSRQLEWVANRVIWLYARIHRPVTLLDYGAGNGALGKALEDALKVVKVTNHDPFHPTWAGLPDPAEHDIVTCCDVMEHIEEQFVPNVLKHIASKARFVAMFAIALTPAKKSLPDGRNAHITLKPHDWWLEQLSPYFMAAEFTSPLNATNITAFKPGYMEAIRKDLQ